MSRIIHAFTDLCLALVFGVSVGASVAAATIFGVSREQGFDKQVANTLAGSMFDRLGWPMLVAALVATVGCLYAVKKPPGRGPWKLLAGAAVAMFALACLTQFVFAPRMADLRANSTWVNGELANEAERTEFRRSHGLSMAVSGVATLIAAGLILGRRLGNKNQA
jgi:ABC-type Fe3+ transport system permease subunit